MPPSTTVIQIASTSSSASVISTARQHFLALFCFPAFTAIFIVSITLIRAIQGNAAARQDMKRYMRSKRQHIKQRYLQSIKHNLSHIGLLCVVIYLFNMYGRPISNISFDFSDDLVGWTGLGKKSLIGKPRVASRVSICPYSFSLSPLHVQPSGGGENGYFVDSL